MVFIIKRLAVLLIAFSSSIEAQQASNFRQDGQPIAAAPVAATATTGLQPPTVDPMALPVGVYYRPSGAEVSGREGATTRFRAVALPGTQHAREPRLLPAGREEHPEGRLRERAHGRVQPRPRARGLPRDAAQGNHESVGSGPSQLHRARLFGRSQRRVLPERPGCRGRGAGRVLCVQQLAVASLVRMAACNAKPSGCSLSGFHRTLAFREQASIPRVFGGANSESCRADFARAFLVDERIPSEWRKPTTPVRLADLGATGTSIQRAMRR